MQIAPRWLIGGPYSYRAGGDVWGRLAGKILHCKGDM
jgi:hypothetical protein